MVTFIGLEQCPQSAVQLFVKPTDILLRQFELTGGVVKSVSLLKNENYRTVLRRHITAFAVYNWGMTLFTPRTAGFTSEAAPQQVIRRNGPDGLVDISESDNGEQEPHDSIAISSQPIQIPTGASVAHEEHDGCAAIERGNR